MKPEDYGKEYLGKCRHWHGVQHPCEAGVDFKKVRLAHAPMNTARGHSLRMSYPCVESLNPAGATCNKRSAYTEEEARVLQKEDDDAVNAVFNGRSPCCKAPVDESRVIKEGRYKGHGPRTCSVCCKLVFQV